MIIQKSRTKISFLPILLLAGATAFAQQSATQQQQPSTPTPQTPGQAATPTANPDAVGPTSAPNYADQAFVEDTLKNNDTQVQLSQLAQQKASSGDVKDFSQKMIQIHTQLNQQLAPLAKQLDVNQSQKPSKQ